ncbi:DNA-binding domain-containing protein [Enterovibrio baiacu]|uniref:HvfC/BufC N-terminal domain-containing protein n=1 Tax=Enterovibrio baiacu TaxID=2491023 RepID=UPI0010120521|nr:DNA-binding domain-containing protein [Enterovibrio baiacu]MBE1275224.1 DUF2063 domain-containing protein [Enterovibrio baiacu]
MNLLAIQDDFQRTVLAKESAGADWVTKSTHGITPEHRIAIYHNAYRVRLMDVLWDTFEHTATYLGDNWFRQLAADYVQTHHSTFNNIGLYGQTFTTFLAEQLPNDLEVAELATLDWTLRRAFDGGNSTVMTMDNLQRLACSDPENFALHPVATLTINTLQFNTLEIWHAIDQDETPPEVAPLPHAIDILIWRKGDSPHFRSISPLESAAIGYVREGYTLNDIGAKLVESFPEEDVSMIFGQLLQQWIGDEVLAVKS